MKYPRELLERQAKTLAAMNDFGIHGFMTDSDELYEHFFNGVTNALKRNGYIPSNYKATSMWFTDSRLCSYDEIEPNRAYFNIEAYDRNYNVKKVSSSEYNGGAKVSLVDDMTLSLVLVECDTLITNIKRMIEIAKNTPSVSELLDEWLGIINEAIKDSEYKAQKEKGKLNLEGGAEPYDCIVIRYKDGGEYHSSIVFGKNHIGIFSAKIRRPLCGECVYDFKLSDARQTLMDIAHSI